MFRSVHFAITPDTIQSKLDKGYKCIFDIDTPSIRFKRPSENIENVNENTKQKVTEENPVSELPQNVNLHEEEDDERKRKEIFHAAMEVIKDSGREHDFLEVLEGLASGTLDPQNIALQLLLDIGSFLAAETVNKVRYSTLTLNFWTLVKKLFYGKATSFFRGYMGEGNTDNSGNLACLYCMFIYVMFLSVLRSVSKSTCLLNWKFQT